MALLRLMRAAYEGRAWETHARGRSCCAQVHELVQRELTDLIAAIQSGERA